eukprot:scaffold192500_cov19-Tisochrysis_lutea.AAC.1
MNVPQVTAEGSQIKSLRCTIEHCLHCASLTAVCSPQSIKQVLRALQCGPAHHRTFINAFTTAGAYTVSSLHPPAGATTVHQADAVVFAVGINAMQKLVTANPALAAQNDFRNIMNLK